MTPLQQNASLVVQRLDRASDIASSAGLPYKCLVFPTTGGVQAIDAAGTVTNLVGATGALTATVTDAATNSASTALTLIHALSAGVGANGIGVTQRFIIPNSLGVLGSAGQFTISYTDATSGSEDSALGITLQVGGVGTGVLTLTAPTAGATTLTAVGSASASLNLVGAGGIVVAPTAVTSGAQNALAVIGAPNTGQDAGGDVPDVIFALDRTVTFQTGPVAVQDAVKIKAPTYAAAAASVFSDVSTLTIDAAPSVTAPSTATRRQTLWVQAGLARFDGGIGQTGANTGSVTVLDLQRLVNAGAVGANDIAASVTLSATNAAGAPWTAGFLTATMSDATTGATHFSLGGAFGGAECEAMRLVGVTGAVVNRINVTPSISGSPVLLNATGDTNTSLAVFGTGTGGITLRNSGNTATIFGVQSVASGNYTPTMWASNESGTPGNATINRPSGQVAVAIGASAVTVTNDLVTATSVVIATLQAIDVTFTQILSVVPGAGSFVITGNAVATAATKIGFIVINPSA